MGRGQNFKDQNCPIDSNLKYFRATTENCKKRRLLIKPLLLDIFVRQNFSRIGPCENSCPDDSENVVLFGRATFLTGVIAAQSQQRAEKVGASAKIGDVKKKTRQQFFDFGAEIESRPEKHIYLGRDSISGPNSKNSE